MNRTQLVKRMIRLSMRAVPNKLSAYRIFSSYSHLVVRPPRHIAYDTLTIGEHMPAMWLHHKNRCESRVVLYLHGGGYVIGSSRSHLELASRIARASKAQLLMVEYRLAPEHPYPAALDDALEAYQYLLDQRIDPDRIVVAGDSAGGGLTVSLLQSIRDRGMPMPAGAVCLSPWLDLSCSMSSMSRTREQDPLITPERIRFFARHYAGTNDRAQPGLSPFFGELEGLPPMLIQVGGDEILLPECKYFSKKAKLHGSEVELQVWPGMFHVWQFAARVLPEARDAIQNIGNFINRTVPVR